VSDLGPAADALERKLATILSADVAAYSRLMAEDEEDTLQRFRSHKAIFEKLVALHRGRIFNTAGDAILAEFGSAVEAVRCATEIQAALRTRNDQLPPDRRLEFRMGVNLGDVIVERGDLLGDGVNLAARLQAAAAPGGICIAGSVYDQIRNKLSLSFTPLGEMTFKNMPQPVRAFAIAAADGLGPLPAPSPQRGAPGSRRPRRPVLAALLLIAAAAALWGHSREQHHRAELRASVASVTRTDAVPKAAPHAAAAGPSRAANPDNLAAEASRTGATPSTAAVGAASPPADKTESDAPLAVRPGAGDFTGNYGGPVCYGAFAGEPARCFHAQALVARRRMAGEWPGWRPGITMYVRGEIRTSGDIAIRLRARRADGSRFDASDLVGTVRDGRINAAGVFRSGRSVNLTWQKN
jgi:class 3 adenylate cyclase